MTSEVQQNYYGWQHGELSDQEDSQDPVSISQIIIDHGSISFGRFAIESLSWEKRSVFTHNERQAELEKFKSPGLVAKKKAYFEEYYKKIRALKAMQNQQTEISLEYGADSSISSQTGDDDEQALTSSKTNEMPERISHAPSENLSVEVSFEQDGKAFEHMEPGSLENATATETVELHNNEVKQGGTCNNSNQMQISDHEPLVHSLFTGSFEEIKPNEGNYVKLTYRNGVLDTYLVPVDNPAQENNMPTSNMEVPMSASMSTKPASKRVNKPILERTKLSLGSKHLPQKAIDKAKIDINLSKETSCKTRSRYKFSLVASQRPPLELQNKVAVPRPVSVSTDRKGAVRTDSREVIISSSKVSIRSASEQYYTKGNFRVQGDSREMAAQRIIKNRALQSKSIGHGEFGMDLENKRKGIERRITTELKSRSINLPSANNIDHSGVIGWQSGNSACGDKSKKVNSPTRSRYEGKGSKQVPTSQQCGHIKFDSVKKQVKHDLPCGPRKPSGGKTLRQENPRWR